MGGADETIPCPRLSHLSAASLGCGQSTPQAPAPTIAYGSSPSAGQTFDHDGIQTK